jgi:hypothetical protein
LRKVRHRPLAERRAGIADFHHGTGRSLYVATISASLRGGVDVLDLNAGMNLLPEQFRRRPVSVIPAKDGRLPTEVRQVATPLRNPYGPHAGCGKNMAEI